MNLTRREVLLATGATLVMPQLLLGSQGKSAPVPAPPSEKHLPHLIIGIFDRRDDHSFRVAHELIQAECEACTKQLVGFMGSTEMQFNEDKTRHFMQIALNWSASCPHKAIYLVNCDSDDPWEEDRISDRIYDQIFQIATEQKSNLQPHAELDWLQLNAKIAGLMSSIFKHQTLEEIQSICRCGIVL
jgi:hypothetical protein